MKTVLCAALTAVLLVPALRAQAEVDSSVIKSLAIDGKPLDVAISSDNARLFVLVDREKVLVFSPAGVLQETLVLEKPADGIELSKSGDVLYLRSTERKSVDVVRLEFVQEIAVGNSPVKGLRSAPVAIAVFNDFQ